MKTLNEHNYDATVPPNNSAGVRCDRCKTVMVYAAPGMQLLTNPPKHKVQCPNCDFVGYKF